MSNSLTNKVDMSLDDIIKLSKSQKWKQARRTKGRGRGDGAPTAHGISRGRGVARNRGRGAGRGWGVKQTINPAKQFNTSAQSRIRGQGRGRGINRQNSGVSPLDRNNTDQKSVTGRGRRRGRGGRGAGLVFTNSRIKQQTGQQPTFGQQQPVDQRQRLNKVRQQAALLREKQLAIKNLQQAKKTVQTINMAIQKTSRESVVNQLRGINNIQPGQPGGRGRRKLLPLMKRQGNNNFSNNTSPVRQLSNTSVTITNPSALDPVPLLGRNRRRWRQNNRVQVTSEHFTIQVANQNLQPVRSQQSAILNELKLLKPAVSTTYKFQKSDFATPATGVSLNDRFSGTTFADGGDSISGERKVFI